jgi:S1-C subfamily serine protease
VAVLHDLFLNSVVSIAEQLKESVYRRIATGFIYGYNVGIEQYKVYIVTNAHVLEGFGKDERIFIVCNEGLG